MTGETAQSVAAPRQGVEAGRHPWNRDLIDLRLTSAETGRVTSGGCWRWL